MKQVDAARFHLNGFPISLGQHGSYNIIPDFLKRMVGPFVNNYTLFYMMEGDYVYYYTQDLILYIYKNVGTTNRYSGEETSFEINDIDKYKPLFYLFSNRGGSIRDDYLLTINACSSSGVNSLDQMMKFIGACQY